jgi:flagellar biosynthetic protein FliR
MVPGYLMVFARLTAMLMVLPFFSYAVVSGRIRAMLAIVLSMVVFPLLKIGRIPVDSWLQLVTMLAQEVLIGTLIGFGATMIFEGFNLAGELIGRQMSFAAINIFDPFSQQEKSVISEFWILLAIICFILINGHHFFIETIFNNFRLIPVGDGHFPPALGASLVTGSGNIFLIALRMGGPILALMLIVDTAMALTARVMPQMNIFFVALPLKIILGILAMISSLYIFQMIFDSIYNEMVTYLGTVLKLIAGH